MKLPASGYCLPLINFLSQSLSWGEFSSPTFSNGLSACRKVFPKRLSRQKKFWNRDLKVKSRCAHKSNHFNVLYKPMILQLSACPEALRKIFGRSVAYIGTTNEGAK
jgi:hypothetical protein